MRRLIYLSLLMMFAMLLAACPADTGVTTETPEVDTGAVEEAETPVTEEVETPAAEEAETPAAEEGETPEAETPEAETPEAEEGETPEAETPEAEGEATVEATAEVTATAEITATAEVTGTEEVTETAGVEGMGIVQVSTDGQFLTDSEGNTLYAFTDDTEGVSTCVGSCAENWPPLTVESEDELTAGEGLDQAMLGTTEREDGTLQVTLNGRPLYLFAGDQAAGDTAGQGVGERWWMVDAEGELIEE